MGFIKYSIGLITMMMLLTACAANSTDENNQSNQTLAKDDDVSALEKEVSAEELTLEDFPEDVYIPETSTLKESNVSEENSIMLSYEVPGHLIDDQDNYKNFLTENGYTMNEVNMSDQMIVFQGSKKGDHFLYYSLVGQEDDAYTLKIEYGKY